MQAKCFVGNGCEPGKRRRLALTQTKKGKAAISFLWDFRITPDLLMLKLGYRLNEQV
jgi:hypothetical protein